MPKLIFTQRAAAELGALGRDAGARVVAKAVRKALGYLESNPRQQSLQTHEYTSMRGPGNEKLFETYAQNQTSSAYRIFWHYGPDEIKGKQRIAVITIIAITPHP